MTIWNIPSINYVFKAASRLIKPDTPPVGVIILAILEQLARIENSALTADSPLTRNAPPLRFLLIWPNGSSTFSFRFL